MSDSGDPASRKAGSMQPDGCKPSDPKSPKKYKAWDKEEMMLLRKGVQRHGVGNWETIRQDPDFQPLKLRTGVQIKDKWRNLVKFRHLTEEEKEAIANRAVKINRRSGRSSSFTFGSGADAKGKADPDPSTLCNGGVGAAGNLATGNTDQAKHLQSLSAYSKAQQDRSQAELEVQEAQAAYAQARTQLNTAQQSNLDSAVVESFVEVANQANGNLDLTKQRLSLARAIENRLMNTVHHQPSPPTTSALLDVPHASAASVSSSSDSAALGSLLAAHIGKGGLQMRPNPAAYGRSQSFDSSSFPRMFGSCEDVAPSEFSTDPQQFSAFPDSYGQPADGGPTLSKLAIRAGTRSPRRMSGSMPSSPLGKARSMGMGRMSSLAIRSGNHHDEYELLNAGRPPAYQQNIDSFGYAGTPDSLGCPAETSSSLAGASTGLNFFPADVTSNTGVSVGGPISSLELQSCNTEPNGMLGFFASSSRNVNSIQPYKTNHLPLEMAMNGLTNDTENGSSATFDGHGSAYNGFEYIQRSNMAVSDFYPLTVHTSVHNDLLKNEENAGHQLPMGSEASWVACGAGYGGFGRMTDGDTLETTCSDAIIDAMDDIMGVESLQEIGHSLEDGCAVDPRFG
mmetsp:Transcript_40313/g.114128  ORF Transcript_40313/g.114128 Transcript_40313/m.114128 type:complete len:623 (-) Transcript_40313:290-2158(-)